MPRHLTGKHSVLCTADCQNVLLKSRPYGSQLGKATETSLSLGYLTRGSSRNLASSEDASEMKGGWAQWSVLASLPRHWSASL